jgi:hypothetical protein
MNGARQSYGFVFGTVAVITALVVAFLPRPGGQPDAGKPDKDKKSPSLDAPQAAAPGAEGPLAPVWAFLGSPHEKAKGYALTLSWDGVLHVSGEPQKPDDEAGFYDWPDRRALQDYRFRFLVATVPDPADSGFASMFDQVLESLQRAVEQGGYVFDRAWLPWQRAAADKAAGPQRQQKHPGLILFRSQTAEAGGKRDLLALLLVGETPTAGIHKEAFHNATRIISYCPAPAKVAKNRLRIVGPFFSGSAPSLRTALEQARPVLAPPGAPAPEEPLIRVVCGGASGFDHRQFVQGTWAGNDPKKAFQTTILPDQLLLHWAFKALGNPANPKKGDVPGAIVVLQESNTGFGQNIRQGLPKDKSKSADGPRFFVLPYPLHISQLRASYSQEQLARLERQGLPRVGRDLPFPSEGGDRADRGREAVQAQAPLMSAAIADLILDNLVTTMAQKGARHVCLVSTDPQDTIFLARLIRGRYPDAQLVTVGANLLFTHEDYNSELRGMIVASTYPLHPPVQGWSAADEGPERLRILFSDHGYEGYYNATLVQLAEGETTDKKRHDDLLQRMLDYGWEGHELKHTLPPIWISVVGGNGQLIPVSYVSPGDYWKDAANNKDQEVKTALEFAFPRPVEPAAAGQTQRAGPNFGLIRPPNMSLLLFVIFLVLNCYYFNWAWRYLRDARWGHRIADLCARYKQRVDFGVVCLAQVLLYGRIAVWAWTPLRAGLWSRDGWLAAATLVVSASAFGMMWYAGVTLLRAYRQEALGPGETRLGRYLKVARKSKRLRPFGESPAAPKDESPYALPLRSGFWIVSADAAMLFLVALVLVCFVWRVAAAMFGETGAEEVLEFERLAHFTNGVSSLLPRLFFCLALFGWGYCLVKKLHLANKQAVACPFPAADSPPFRDLIKLDGEVRSELMPPSTIRNHFIGCVGLFGLVVLAFLKLWHDHLPPVDGVLFGYVTLAGFCTGAFFLLFTLLQFYWAWRLLRRLLRALALLPMQGAFERLGDKVVALFGHYQFSLRAHLAVRVQQYHLLRAAFPAFRKAVEYGAWGLERHGTLGPSTLAQVWAEVQNAFPEPDLSPPIAELFEQESARHARDPAEGATRELGSETRAACRLLAERCLRVLKPLWPAQTMEGAFGRSQPSGQEAVAQPGREAATPLFLSLPEGDPIREWATAAESFVAAEVVGYLSQFTAQLRTLLTSLTVGSLLLVLAATVYPFHPQHQMLLFLTVLGGGAAAAIAVFLIQFNSDELVSRISRSTPNRFTPDWPFLQGAAAYVLPIVAAVMIQFPFVTSTLRSLLDPLFHIVK